MLHLILVANDAYHATGSTISAYRIADERLKRSMWPIYKGTEIEWRFRLRTDFLCT